MRNFQRVGENVNVGPLTHQLIRHKELWNQNKFRTTFPDTPHGEVEDIWLRFSAKENCTTTTKVIGDGTPVWYPARDVLTAARPLILNLMAGMGAYELGRVLISRVPPGGKILAHRDNAGDYVHEPDIARYHVVLQGLPGSLYHCGEPDGAENPDVETVNMMTGEVWWFDAHKLHWIENNSADDRIHMLVDVRLW
jgi:hypothetical protein